MERKVNSPVSFDTERDTSYSTRYDDRETLNGTQVAKLDCLTTNLRNEINDTFDCGDIIRLENLVEQYFRDGITAQKDDNIGYYIRYVRAYERSTELINAFYDGLEPIVFKL